MTLAQASLFLGFVFPTFWLSATFALLSLAAISFYVLNLLAAWNFLRRKSPETASRAAVPVSILKPLKGCDPQMYESFRSHCLLDYPEFEIVFGVSAPQSGGANSASDDAVEYVERLKREFPERQIKLVICDRVLGANGKVSNLVQMLEHVRYQHVLINDSDIRVPPTYLRQVMKYFAITQNAVGRERVGMVTCLYRAIPGKSLWSKLEALGVCAEFVPGVLTALLLERRVRFGLGSTLAVSFEALGAMGGMQKLVDHLADDYELGMGIINAGYKVELASVVVETFLPDYGFADFFEHQLRWGRTVRTSRPAGYAGMFVIYGLLWSLLSVITSGRAAWSWMLLGAVAVLRAVVVGAYSAVLADPLSMRHFWLLPLRDLIAPVVWLVSMFGKKIVWRGEQFELEKGKLRRV